MSQAREPRSPGVFMGRILGIPLYVAPSWFLIAAVFTVLVAQGLPNQFPDISTQGQYGAGALFVVLLYLSVLVHELSHSVVAKLLGLPVRRIVLLLIGGVSELEREPETAGREYLVAVAGPLVSLVLAGSGFAIEEALGGDSVVRLIVFQVAVANV